MLVIVSRDDIYTAMGLIAMRSDRILPSILMIFIVKSFFLPVSVYATFLPPGSRSQLLSSPEAIPTRKTPYVITPERRAILNTIRYAEGTWRGGLDIGYRVMFGGGLMTSFDRHPNRVIQSKSRYSSSAAGAYQFMPFTWTLVQRRLGVVGFSPEAQDQGALFLIQRRRALSLTDTGNLTPLLTAMLAPEWASFPTLIGKSFYGQPVKSYLKLLSFYELNLRELRRLRNKNNEKSLISSTLLGSSCGSFLSSCKSKLDCYSPFRIIKAASYRELGDKICPN